MHYHVVFLEGVYLDRTDQGLKPRFVKGEPPSDADIAEVVQTISQRVIRKLRSLEYLEADSAAAVATGYDPLMDDEPALAWRDYVGAGSAATFTPWRPPSRSVLPLASGPGSRCDGLARALGMKVNPPH